MERLEGVTADRAPVLPPAAAGEVVPVVLCGGGGERLWPLSRAAVPKHLLRLAGRPSLLESTIARLRGATSLSRAMLVICNEGDRFLVDGQVRAVAGADARLIAEPARRDSAAAVALAVAAACEVDPDIVLLVAPADHVIDDVAAFDAAVRSAGAVARGGCIVTFGIAPDRPNPQYGYLRAGAPLGESGAHEVERFVEKPPAETAAAMLAEGGWYWNSGMFVFRAGVMREALAESFPTGWAAASAAWAARRTDLGMVRLDHDIFAAAPRISIDYAVMERAKNLAVIPARFDWNDVGLWSSLADMLPADADGNAAFGRTLLADSRDSLVYSDSDVLVAAFGLDGMLVAVTRDAILVCPKERTRDLKALVAQIRERGFAEADHHRSAYRPWGHYEPVAAGERYQVKRLVIQPGGVLSLQKHHHRAEHWVVVRGTAQVTIGETVTTVSENQSIYIPVGTLHRLENPGRIDLEIIEVQTGAYLGEDDIVRLSDVYGRG